MRFIKIAGIIWGLIYFAMGAMKSFTLNSNDRWASVALLFGLFLLPLPITIIAAWFPKIGGLALWGCVAIDVVSVADVVVLRHSYPVSEIGHFIVFIALYDIPHLAFGWGYLRAGPASRDAGSSDQTQYLGTA